VVRLPFESVEVELVPGPERRVLLRTGPPGSSITEASVLALYGAPYPSEDEARSDGGIWANKLRRAFAAVGATARFELGPSNFTESALADLSSARRVPVLNDDNGVVTLIHNPQTLFARIELGPSVRPNQAATVTALCSDHASSELTASQMRAYRFWSEADFLTIPAARFALLMIALEALSDPQPRTGETLAHLQVLIDTTMQAQIPKEERDSLVGALAALEHEAVRNACIRAAMEWGERTYGGLPAVDFVKLCFRRRNALMHGRRDLPNFEEAARLAAELSRFVGELLAGRQLIEEIDAVRAR
jgi:hypothetical protein